MTDEQFQDITERYEAAKRIAELLDLPKNVLIRASDVEALLAEIRRLRGDQVDRATVVWSDADAYRDEVWFPTL